MQKKSATIIGAGIIGLSIGRALQEAGIQTTILEAQKNLACGNNYRNSAVIHAGIYYSVDSLKAKFCKAGAALLYQFCEENHIDFKKRGKIIVATSKDQMDSLTALREKALKNGVRDIIALSAKEIASMEPEVKCYAGIFSPSTGVIDVGRFIETLHAKFIQMGGESYFSTKALSIKKEDKYITKYIQEDKISYMKGDLLINSAGLQATAVSHSMDFLETAAIPKLYYAKGNYFKLDRKDIFNKLIYPLPEKGGLGIHATTDIHGNTRFGPDVQWIDSSEDWSVDVRRKESFIENISLWFPHVKDHDLQVDFCGVRPKLQYDSNQGQDFFIQTAQQHGHVGLINLYGIESPGLTSSLAIANYIAQQCVL
jgi:L-2-hydroxyglutarate oxidase LhgO